MGQCYSVGLKIKVKHNSEEKAAEALRLHMLQDDKTEYNFEEFADFGVGTEELDDLIRNCLAGWKSSPYCMEEVLKVAFYKLKSEYYYHLSKEIEFEVESKHFENTKNL